MTAPAPYFPPLNIGGTVYDLGHLDPVRFQVPSEKLRRAVTIRCRFSNHVFTRTFDPRVDPAGTTIVMDGIRQRVFCPDRYRMSVHLPGAIVGLREPRIFGFLYSMVRKATGPDPEGGGNRSFSEISLPPIWAYDLGGIFGGGMPTESRSFSSEKSYSPSRLM